MGFARNLRREAKHNIRQAYLRFVGEKPPQKKSTATQWLAANPAFGEVFDIGNAYRLNAPPRSMAGATHEIPGCLEKMSAKRRTDFQHYLYRSQTRDLPGDKIFCLQGGTKVTAVGVAVITPDGYLLSDLGETKFAQQGDPNDFVYRGYLPPCQKLSGSLGVLSYGCCERNYFHLLMEGVPKLRFFQQLGIWPDRFYAPFRHSYDRQLLELFGVRSAKIIPERWTTHVQADEVYVPTTTLYPKQDTVEYLFQTMAEKPWSKTSSGRGKRIYISRSKMKVRSVQNEKELMAMLTRYGFECWHLESLSVRQQIELFQQAEIITGPHGAGFANMVFTPPGAKVIEIGTVWRPYACFQEICSVKKHDFHWYIAKSIDARGEEANMTVPVADFEAFLCERILSKRAAA